MRYAVLLRGVNVGGVKVKMAVLRGAFAEAGFADVKTLLASGNVLVDHRGGPEAVKALAEQTLRDTFGYEAWVLVYDLEQIREVVDGYPFERDDDAQHPYVIFSEDGASSGELAEVDDLDPVLERVQLGPHGVLYWQVDRGETLRSKVGRASAKAKYKSTTTTRNLRTVEKLLA
ncbi:MAG: DUF1697 domain-containing protein [Patulibacter minatonensis]